MAPTIRGNSLYTLTTNGSWTASESFAIQLGGHLVTVNDAAENGWLTSTMLGSSGKWIGYYQTGPNSGYRWVSGESSSFSSWYPGFPDFPSWELYAYLGGSGGWFDCNNEGGGNLGLGQGIAEIPLTLSITQSAQPKEGTRPFTTSINLSAGTQSSGNLAEGSQVWWKVTGITQDDISSGALTGSGTITNGKLDIQHSLVADADTGEQFSVSVYSDSGMTQQIGTTSSAAVQEAPIVRGNSLYSIVDGPSWTQAEANAVKLGGHLLSVSDSSENEFAWQSLGVNRWIGLTDADAEGAWKWTSGESLNYQNWVDWAFSQGPTEDYAWFWGAYPGQWDDNNLTGEWGGGPPNVTTGIAETPFIRHGDSAYVIVQGPTWEEAEANAVALGGHLVTINDWNEEYYLLNNSPGGWIGYTDKEKEGDWRWADGTTRGYERWDPSNPSNNGGVENYAYLDRGAYFGWGAGWNDIPNNSGMMGIAEIKLAPNNTPTGTPTITGTLKAGSSLTINASTIQDADNFTGYTPTYQYSWETSTDGTTWSKLTSTDATDNNNTYTLTAEETGKQIRGVVDYLDGCGTNEVVVSDASEMVRAEIRKPIVRGNSIYTLADGPTGIEANNNAIRLGGTLIGAAKIWEYRDFLVDSFPRNFNTENPIPVIYLPEQVDLPASGYLPFDNLSVSTFPNATQAIVEIPFIRRGDSAYVIVQGPTWEEAEANAVALGGHLVTINDSEENKFLHNSFGKNYSQGIWLGGTDKNREGVWTWADGSPWNYQNWEAGQPDNSSNPNYNTAGEDYLQYVGEWKNGTWNDIANEINNVSPGSDLASYVGIAEIRLAPNNAPTGTPGITGTLKTGSTLTIDASTIQDADNFTGYTPAYQYSWETSTDGSTWSELTSADATDNDQTYSLTPEEIGKRIRGVVSYLDGYGTDEVVISDAQERVEAEFKQPIVRGNSLYTIVDGPSWTQAEANSVRLGGHLATISSGEENDFLSGRYASPALTQTDIDAWQPEDAKNIQLWIGFTDALQEGTWRWASGNQATYTNWRPGEPDENITAVVRGGEDYASFLLYDNGFASPGQWGDICDVSVGGGIAEIPLTLSITRSTTPKEGTGPFTTSINLSAGTQSSGNLAEGSQVWWKVTGITQDDLASGALTGSGTITNGKLEVQHSLVTDADTGEQFSVSVYSDSGMTQQIGATSSVAVQEAPIVRGNSLYTIVDGPTWPQAEANAVKLGGHLASLNSENENQFLRQAFDLFDPKTGGPTNPHSIWIGLYDASVNGGWRWKDETTPQSNGWNNWEPTTPTMQPDNIGAETVVKMNPDPQGSWQNSTPDWIPNVNSGISETPFIRRGDSAYVIVQGPTWEEAEANAVRLGGHLVTINDAAENDWVYSTIAKDLPVWVWLGGTDRIIEGDWQWADGSPWNYTNWNSNQPDNDTHWNANGEDYLQYCPGHPEYSDSWNDNWNNPAGTLLGIAEIKLAPNNIPTGTPGITGSLKAGSTLTIDASSIQDADNFTGYTPTYQYSWETSTDGTTWSVLTSADATDNDQTYSLTPEEIGKRIRGVVSYLDGYGTTETVTTSVSAVGIDSLKKAFRNGSEYILLPTDGTKWWVQAENEATALGGHLATIEDANENQWILETFREPAIRYARDNNLPDQEMIALWIGLSDKESEGHWKWADGTNSTYGSWVNGEPATYAGNDEDYAAMLLVDRPGWATAGKWHDLYSDTRGTDLPFAIVEIKHANNAPTGSPSITGTLKAGSTLSIDASTIQDADNFDGYTPTYQYSWETSTDGNTWSELTSAEATDNDQTYTLTAEEVGKQIRGVVSYLDGYGTDESIPTDGASVTSETIGVNQAPTNLSLSSTSFKENLAAASVVATLSTTDPNSDDSFTYSLVSGTGSANNTAFTIDGNQLRINKKPDFEGKSSYSIRLRTSDVGGLDFEKSVTLNVTNVNEAPTAISPSSQAINENLAAGSVIATLGTTDPDSGDSFTYALVGGPGSVDNAAFSINRSALSINATPDFETKSSYSIRVRSTDAGGLSFDKILTVTVNDLVEGPANVAPTNLSLSSTSFSENIPLGSVVATLSTSDPNGDDSFIYELVGGSGSADNAAFSVDGNQLKINASPDFETQGSYNIRIRTSDSGGLTLENAVALTVTNVDEAPSTINLSSTTFNENIAAGTAVATVGGIDPDTGDSLTYSLVAGTGSTDNNAFSISGNQLRINTSPDFETKSAYKVRIRATDSGGLSTEQAYTLSVIDLNDTSTSIAKPGITVRTVSGDDSTSEAGAQSSYSFVLNTAPTDPVTLKFTVSDATEAVLITANPLVFSTSDWNVPQTLIVQGLDDYEDDGNITYIVSTTIASADPDYGPRRDGTGGATVANLELTNQDDGLEDPLTIYGDSTGAAANDQLRGNNGKDRLYGLLGRDRLYGGIGDDRLYGNVDDDTLWGEAGDDDLYGEQDDDELYGGDGNDRLTGGEGKDHLIGGKGDDTYVIDDEFDVIDDQGLEADKDRVIIRGNIAAYTLPAGIQGATLESNAAKNLTGNSIGNDLVGNDNDNLIDGGDGDDELYAASGNDKVIGGAGNDKIVGGDGKGDDTYEGGIGIDTVIYKSSVANPINVNLRTGLASGAEIGTDSLKEIENITAGQVDDTLTGDSQDNTIDGLAGSDTVCFQGPLANYQIRQEQNGDLVIQDSITGRDGTDTLLNVEKLTFGTQTYTIAEALKGTVDKVTGGQTNQLDGGTGSQINLAADDDIINFSAPSFSQIVTTPIRGFEPANDSLSLSRSTFTAATSAKVLTIRSAAPTGNKKKDKAAKKAQSKLLKKAGKTGDPFIYNQITGELIYDQNGKAPGFGDGGTFATFTDQPLITSANLVLS